MKSGAGDDPFADDPLEDDSAADDPLEDDRIEADQREDNQNEDEQTSAETDADTNAHTEPTGRSSPTDGPDDDRRDRTDRRTADADTVGAEPDVGEGARASRSSPARSTAAADSSPPGLDADTTSPRDRRPTDASPEHADAADIPWVLRRSGVKDARSNMTQFFLRDDTDRAERAFRSDVEDILEKDVYLLDLREAAYLVAMEHPDEVAEVLREWGYDYL